MADRTAAVYARYSSENQSATSIDDQVSSCRRYAERNGLYVPAAHIYTDLAVSGARRNRRGWSALRAAAERRLFGFVLVDDLSRVSRDLVFLLGDVARFTYLDIGIVSVADGIHTLDEEQLLSLQVRGVFNEHQLRDLRKKTHRGQLGQKERGFSVGEATFGYRSEPVGEVRERKTGRARPDGHVMRIDPVQAEVVRRVFREFADGSSLAAIAGRLNADGVPGRYRISKGWSVGTLTRMLCNRKYEGVWIWNKTRNVRDPSTGACRQVERPESEWHVVEDEGLRIVDAELWTSVQARRKRVGRAWPGGRGRRGFSADQRGVAGTCPRYLLSGAMECGVCGRAVCLLSGKGSGYYGCSGVPIRACENRVRVPRLLAEEVVLGAVAELLRDSEAIAAVLSAVERRLRSLKGGVPETLAAKRAELRRAERERANLVAFVARGADDVGARAVREELEKLEPRVQRLRDEIGRLERVSETEMRAPSPGWIRERVGHLRQVLELRTAKSAELLRRLLGPIRLVPVFPSSGRPYYQARTALDTLELLPGSESGGDSDAGAKSLRWWTCCATRTRRPRSSAAASAPARRARRRPRSTPCSPGD